MWRMRWRGLLAAVLVVLPAAGAAPRVAAQAPPERPNVLIILTDDQRASGTLHAMPRTRKWFLEGGTRYVNALATTPTCCPSRASIMTGLYAHNHGVHTSADGQAENMDQALTMQRHLRDDGYRTGIFGKYLNGWGREVDPPSFDEWAILSSGTSRIYYDGRWNVQGRPKLLRKYSTRIVQKKALEFLRAGEGADDQPWLLYVTPTSPHLPAIPEPSHADTDIPRMNLTPAMLEEDRSDKPPEVREQEIPLSQVREWRRQQLRSLKSVDEMVGSLLSVLVELGESEDTLAIFLSDNGFLWGEHGLSQKIRPYAASVEIPFLVRWPGHVEPGGVDERLIANLDIAPTVLEAAGVEPRHSYDGRSFLTSERDRLLLEQWKRPARTVPDWAATRTPDYLYVEYYAEDRLVPGYREYYDLVEDPWELLNLLGDADPTNDPPTAAELSVQLHRDVSCAGTTGPSACP